MIFENKVINLPKGKNFSVYVKGKNELDLYFVDNGIKKKKIYLDGIVRLENQNINLAYEYVCQISNYHLCKCIKGNISVVEYNE